jgi:uncharacterized membrane protein
MPSRKSDPRPEAPGACAADSEHLVGALVLMMAGVAYLVVERQMVRENGPQSVLAEAVGRDRKGLVSLIGYVAAIALAFVSPRLADLIYALVAVMWIVPDRRISGRVSS